MNPNVNLGAGFAQPVNPGPLAVPAPSTCSFGDLFSDQNKDPLKGNYGPLFNPFSIDINNANNSTSPTVLRDLIASTGAQRHLLALVVINDNKARVAICPQRFERSLGSPPSDLDGRLFAFDGDLFQNQGHTVEITNDYFTLVPNQVQVPTVGHILNQLAANPNLEFFGPYAAQDANTEVVRVRKTIPIPFKYVSLFLAREVTPTYFFNHIYPQMVTDGVEQACLPFVHFFQIAMTRQAANQASALEVPLLVAPARNSQLLEVRHQLIQHHFPQINQSLVGLQQNQIATQLALMRQQQELSKVQEEQRKQDEKETSVEKILGKERLSTLLRLSRVNSESALAPFWSRLADVKKSSWLSVLQAFLDNNREQLGEKHLTFPADNALLNTALSMVWGMVTKDSIETGINLFRLSDTDLESAQQRLAEVELIMSGGANPSLADAQEALKSKITMPPSDGSNRNVRRMQILMMTLLPAGHPLHQYLEFHHKDMESFRSVFNTWTPARPELAPARGILHLKSISTELSEYFKEQGRSPNEITLPDPCAISKAIEREQLWEPQLSHIFIVKYKIYEYCNFAPSAPTVTIPSTSFSADKTPSLGTTNTAGRVNNIDFNAEIFKGYKDRNVRSASIRSKVKAQELDPLPMSKVDQGPMCLAWHTKGQCNGACPRKDDHVSYSKNEYAALVAWCKKNYPASE